MYLIKKHPVCPVCGSRTYQTRNGGGNYFICENPECKGTISFNRAYQLQLDREKAAQVIARMHNA